MWCTAWPIVLCLELCKIIYLAAPAVSCGGLNAKPAKYIAKKKKWHCHCLAVGGLLSSPTAAKATWRGNMSCHVLNKCQGISVDAHRIHRISLLITKMSMTEVLVNTSRDLSQYQKALPPCTHGLISSGFPLSGWQAAPKTPGLTPRGKIRAHLRVEFIKPPSHLWLWGQRRRKCIQLLYIIVCYLRN